MTIKELNRDIKSLNKYIKGISQAADLMKDNAAYYRDIENVAKPEFIRLYHAANDFKALTKDTILIMLRLNISHRFIALHNFGNLIEI